MIFCSNCFHNLEIKSIIEERGSLGSCPICGTMDVKVYDTEKDEFITGFIDDQSTREDEKIPVIIWTNHGTDVHCTTNLDRDSWETTKS